MSGQVRTLLDRFRRRRPAAAVLMYHRIAEADCDPWALAVSPRQFEVQLQWLRREREVLPLDAFGALLARGALPPRAVAITFDDGYACNALTAAPMLLATGLPATFFLATGAIGGMREFWWDALARLVIQTAAPAQTSVMVGGTRFDVDFTAPLVEPVTLAAWRWWHKTQDRRLRLYIDLYAAMRPQTVAEQEAVIDTLALSCGLALAARAGYRAMTIAEAQSLAATEKLQIAPHTVTHPQLSSLNPAAQRREILDSRHACQDWSAATAPLFSYPYGDFTPATATIVQEAGFALACSTAGTPVEPHCSAFAIPRLQVLDRPPLWLERTMAA